MKNFFNKILDEPTSQPIFKFVPQIKISQKSTLHLQIEPKDPHTASNIVINAFVSKNNRTIVPIRVQWSRYKFKTEETFAKEKMSSISGNTYMCQPADLGSIIEAKVRCIDPQISGQAEATIGPIRIDAMLKRLIDGALYDENLLSQVVIVEGKEKLNVNFRLKSKTMEFMEVESSQKLTMKYSLSEPKIQLSPKDPTKVYLRFQQDTNDIVRKWLNKVFKVDRQPHNLNESSLSMKIPYSNVSSVSSKNKLFSKSHITCTNKIEVRFLSRNTRDLFLFSLRAFICKEDMKNCFIMEKIQTLQSLKNETDYDKFLEYCSLKAEIIRLAQIAKELQNDRDNKIKDINNMQESISQMTLTYLKIIEEKSQQQHVDLEQSYSMISMKRQQILGRKNLRQLKSQNQQLKNKIKNLTEQLELNKFFRKDDNQSMIFNQTTNPFLKKNNLSNIIDQNQSGNSYYLAVPEKQKAQSRNVLEMSRSYLKVLEENKRLKAEKSIKNNSPQKQQDDIQNLLQSLHESQAEEKKVTDLQAKVKTLTLQLGQLTTQNQKLSRLRAQLTENNVELRNKVSDLSERLQKELSAPQQNSFIENSYYTSRIGQNASMSSINTSYISMNQSMTSEAELGLLQKKLIDLANINRKFETENTRLRRQRDYFRTLYEKSKAQIELIGNKVPEIGESRPKELSQSHVSNGNPDNSVLMQIRQQKEQLENQKKTLLRKIQSLSKQTSQMKENIIFEKKCVELTRQNEKLMEENQKLERLLENYKTTKQKDQNTEVNNSQKSQEQIQKLKKVNNRFLEEIKTLKIQLERRKDPALDSSRVIELQNQLDIFRSYSKGSSNQFSPNGQSVSQRQKELMQELSRLKKENQRLKEQIQSLQNKTKNQTQTIQKLMTELDSYHQQSVNNEIKDVSSSYIENSFSKKYLVGQGMPLHDRIIQEKSLNDISIGNQRSLIEKYEKKVADLEAQLCILRRNSEAMNRSRDLSMSMMGYEEERMELLKKQNETLIQQNQNLSKMCSKYNKDARQANLELNKLRQKLREQTQIRLPSQ